MKSLTIKFSTRSLLLSIICFVLLNGSTSMAATETLKLRKQGGDIRLNMVFSLEENKFAGLPANTVEIRNTGRVILGIDQFNNTYINEPKEIIVTMDIKRWTDPTNSTVLYLNKPFRITYVPDNNYYDLFVLKREDCRKIEVTVKSITLDGKSVSDLANAPYVYLDLEVETERYYPFNTATLVNNVNERFLDDMAQLEMFWSVKEGAEAYELEWTSVDDYNYNSDGQLITADPSKIEFNFSNNSTRITTSNNYYSIPLLFERGYLLYRVRAISKSPKDLEKYVYSIWSAPGSGYVPECPNRYAINEAHELEKPWTYSASYAENGLKKEVVNYFDGTLRGRQSVSVLNTQNEAIVQENIYDNLGRPAISVLPTPVDIARLQYYDAFNVNISNVPYSWTDFDTDTDPCSVITAPMGNEESGAARYYSENTVYDPETEKHQAYLPKAEGFPFAQTEYTADNTGKIRRQGGVGPEFQLSSTTDANHESYFFYGQPTQIELDRLFGSDAGFADHYKKNMAVDPNGQVSVSYFDLKGNTIATALAGGNPVSLDPLPSLSNEEAIEAILIDYMAPSNNNKIIGNTIEFIYQLVVPGPGSYKFIYTTDPIHYSPECSNLQDCFDGISDLDISITNECGVEFIVGGKIETTVGNINSLDKNCPVDSHFFNSFTAEFEKAGVYTLTKKLTVNQFALDVYSDLFMDTIGAGDNPCLPDLYSMLKDAIKEIDTTMCNFDCDQEGGCSGSLGENYQTHVTMFNENALTEEEYNIAMDECISACEQSNNPSNSIIGMLLADVYPGGQYAGYDYNSSGDITSELSVLNQNNYLPGSVAHPHANWKYPIDAYLDINNNQAYVALNEINPGEYVPPVEVGKVIHFVKLLENGSYLEDPNDEDCTIPAVFPEDLEQLTDFVNFFDKSWCNALVQYHPEYPYYVWLEKNKDTTFQGKSSDEFDALLNQLETFGHALVPFTDLEDTEIIDDLLDSDPYFNGSGQGIDQKSEMHTKLAVVAEQNGITYNVKQMVAASVKCRQTYDETTPIPNPSDLCLQFFSLGDDPKVLDGEWELYKHMYLKYKQILQQEAAHQYAINPGNGYNGCIGVGEEGFNQGDNGFGGQFETNQYQPCYKDYYNYFATKQKRYVDKDIDPRIPAYADDDPELVDELENLLNGNTFLTTGQCPVATHITNLLNSLVTEEQLTASQLYPAELINYKSFTPLLYNMLNPNGGLAREFIWVTDFDISPPPSGVLSGNFVSEHESFGSLSLEWLDNDHPKCDWDEITMFFNLLYAEESSDNFKFRVSAIYSKDDGTTGQVLLFGNTSLKLNNCDENSFENFKPTAFAFDLQALWNIRASEGVFTLNHGAGTELWYPPYDDYMTPEIWRNLNSISQVSGNWAWSYNTTYWDMYETGVSCPYWTCRVNITSIEQGCDFADLLFFKDIRNLNGEVNYFRVTAVTDNSGTQEEYDIEGYVTLIKSCGTLPPLPLPMIENNADFLLCDEPEVHVKEDLEALLNYLAEVNKLVSFYSSYYLGDKPSFTDLLKSFLLGSSVYWDAGEWEPNLFVGQFSGGQACGVSGSLSLKPFNCNQNIDFELIAHFNNLTAIYGENSNGSTTYDFIVDAIMTDNSIIKLAGNTDCFPLKNCNDCYDLYLPFTKEVCTVEYADLSAMINSPYVHDTIFIGRQDNFCEFNLGYCTDDYLFYIAEIEDELGISLLEIDDPDSNPLFVSLGEFCSNGLSYSENPGTPFYSQFLTIVKKIHNEILVEPLVLGESHYFYTLTEFNDISFAQCLTCYSDYIDAYLGNPDELQNIEDFTRGNMCTKIPRNDCPKMPSNIFFSPTAPYINPCKQELIAVETAGVIDLYNYLMDSIREAFILEYRTECLQAGESLKMKYKDAEYHYTLYYYDRAGNLVKTIPPEGVRPITDQEKLNNIVANRINNTLDFILPEHTLPTRYRYDSRGLLIEQTTPDAGKSIFIYDVLGRMRFSQNAKQLETSYFSYTKYDEQGRIKETGESNQKEIIDMIAIGELSNEVLLNNSLPEKGNRNITQTIYDSPSTDFFKQQNLRSRVAAITYDNGGNGTPDFSTHYSYDIHGNVNVVVQENNFFKGTADNFKRIDYEYDLVSGNVNKVSYQHQQYDAFYHKYNYDADNRITEVFTSKDDVIWKRDAKYIYYKHGPLARVELGNNMVQGIDYAYTLQGWLKGVNSNTLVASRDIGKDGKSDDIHQFVGSDAYGFNLGYYLNDYRAVKPGMAIDGSFIAYNGENVDRPLYNGNISSMASTIHQYNLKDNWHAVPGLSHFAYDQLNRIASSQVFTSNTVIGTNNWSGYANPGVKAYNTNYSYDANGNILSLLRNGQPGQEDMDNLGYIYDRVDPLDVTSDLLNNRLISVTDAVTISGYDDDITSQSIKNYGYDVIGNLIYDRAEEIWNIDWNASNKIVRISRDIGSRKQNLQFEYDGLGNRVFKQTYPNLGTSEDVNYTWYVRDAQGNVMAVYKWKGSSAPQLAELTIYGSSRLGYVDFMADKAVKSQQVDFQHITGLRKYELSNHLGNVMTVISDRPVANVGPINNGKVDHYTADFISSQDYYPGGMLMPGRNFNSDSYRYGGAGGQEMDNEIYGSTGTSYTAEYWQYDSRLLRRWNTDPEPKTYESPYAAFSNNPIWFTDPNGRDTIVNPNGEKMNAGDGYATSNDKTVLYGEDLQTKVWNPTALGSGGEYNGNYENYNSKKHGKINNANSATATIENALNNVNRSISQGGLLQDLSNDPGFKTFESDVLQQAMKDTRFGNSAFAFDYNNGQGRLITFGGESNSYLPMSVQAVVTLSPLLSFVMFPNTWSAAFTNTTWVVRHTYVKARVEVTANGVMGVTFSFEDVLDLKEGEQGDTYNFVVRQLGKVWPGNQEMKVNGAWHNKYKKK